VFGRDSAVTPVSIVFDPAGERLACSFTDGSVRLWARGSWTPSRMRGPARLWRAITFSPDGSRIWAWTERSTGIGIFDALHPGWLLTLPVGELELDDVAFDPVHRRLLAATADRKRLVFLEASVEHARPLWEGLARRERDDRLLAARVDSVLVGEAQAEVRADAGLDARQKERLLARLEWIGDPLPDELNNAAWRVVDPEGSRRGDVEEALRSARAAVKLEPALAEYRETLGWALFWNGRHDEAEAEAQRALDLAPDHLKRALQDNLALLRSEIDAQRRGR